MLVLLRALPDDARTRRLDPDEPYWGMLHELVAQQVDLTSIMAAGRQTKQPRVVPRPWSSKATTAAAAVRSAGAQHQQQLNPGERRTTGLVDATAAMAAWAERNGGAVVNGQPFDGGV